jgi:HicB family
MSDPKRERIGFPLRLPKSLKERATLLAHRDGVSLNHFVSQAVAEKVSRLVPATGTPLASEQDSQETRRSGHAALQPALRTTPAAAEQTAPK